MTPQVSLAIFIALSFVGVILLWMLHPPEKIDPGTLAVLNTLTGILGAAFGAVVTYFFGSSSQSKDKDATITTLAANTGTGTGMGATVPTTPPVPATPPVRPPTPAGTPGSTDLGRIQP